MSRLAISTCTLCLLVGLVACEKEERQLIESRNNTASNNANNITPNNANNANNITPNNTTANNANNTTANNQTNVGPPIGDFDENTHAFVRITWSGGGGDAKNLDLHALEPGSSHLYYVRTESENGRFADLPVCDGGPDCDGSEDAPSEVIYWSADGMRQGHYDVWVENASEQPALFRIEIEAGNASVAEEGYVAPQSESLHYEFDVGETTPFSAETDCQQTLEDLGISYRPVTVLQTIECDVDDAVLTEGALGPVDYRVGWKTEVTSLRTACTFGVALEALAGVLQTAGVTEVWHRGVFRCETIADTGSTNGHLTGEALSVTGLVDDGGTTYEVATDWGNGAAEGQFLQDVVQAIDDDPSFTVVTPDDGAPTDRLRIELAEPPMQ